MTYFKECSTCLIFPSEVRKSLPQQNLNVFMKNSVVFSLYIDIILFTITRTLASLILHELLSRIFWGLLLFILHKPLLFKAGKLIRFQDFGVKAQ